MTTSHPLIPTCLIGFSGKLQKGNARCQHRDFRQRSGCGDPPREMVDGQQEPVSPRGKVQAGRAQWRRQIPGGRPQPTTPARRRREGGTRRTCAPERGALRPFRRSIDPLGARGRTSPTASQSPDTRQTARPFDAMNHRRSAPPALGPLHPRTSARATGTDELMASTITWSHEDRGRSISWSARKWFGEVAHSS